MCTFVSFFLDKSTVYPALKRYELTGSHHDRPKSGHPRGSSERDDRSLIRASLRNRKSTVPDLRLAWQESNVFASNTTVRRRLQVAGLSGHLAVKKPLLTARNKQRCLQIAREHLQWSWVDWSTVLFTDESKFNMFQSDRGSI